MQKKRVAFTLIEILISLMLLSIVLLALYRSLDMLQSSNRQLYEHLEKSEIEKEAIQALYLDIAGSDGNITIKNNEFAQFCLESTINTLYNSPNSKVCWVVAKENNRLLRSEGVNYSLPTNIDDVVAIDAVLNNIELFQVYRSKENILVVLKQKNKNPLSFVVYGISEPLPLKKKPNPNSNTSVEKNPPNKSENVTPSTQNVL